MADYLSLETETGVADIWDTDTQAPAESELPAFVDVDCGLSASDIMARIEGVVQKLVEDLAQGIVPTIQLVSRSSKNSFITDSSQLRQSQQLGTSSQADAPGPSNPQLVVGLRERLQTRCMLQNQGQGAYGFTRVFKVMEAVHELLRSGRQATQRDLYYKLQSPPLFTSSKDVNTAIQDVVALLRVPRSSLGITCSSRGAVSGKLYIKDGPMGAWQDCSSAGNGGRAIPGDIASLAGYSFQCSARYLLIIEKDAIFQRLNEDRLFDAVPCVMITAKGMPDLATRAFANHLLRSFPQLMVLGLVDYNPAGITILKTYKYGSRAMGLESHRYALPTLKWLGLRSSMLEDVEATSLQPLTTRDRTLLSSLKGALKDVEPGWIQELQCMEDAGFKGDIEAVYSVHGYGGLKDMLARYILRRDFV